MNLQIVGVPTTKIRERKKKGSNACIIYCITISKEYTVFECMCIIFVINLKHQYVHFLTKCDWLEIIRHCLAPLTGNFEVPQNIPQNAFLHFLILFNYNYDIVDTSSVRQHWLTKKATYFHFQQDNITYDFVISPILSSETFTMNLEWKGHSWTIEHRNTVTNIQQQQLLPAFSTSQQIFFTAFIWTGPLS